jgi:hypothetical protein
MAEGTGGLVVVTAKTLARREQSIFIGVQGQILRE